MARYKFVEVKEPILTIKAKDRIEVTPAINDENLRLLIYHSGAITSMVFNEKAIENLHRILGEWLEQRKDHKNEKSD